MIENNENRIAIIDHEDNEIISWNCEEWKNNSEVVNEIVECVKVYYENGAGYLKSLLNSDIYE